MSNQQLGDRQCGEILAQMDVFLDCALTDPARNFVLMHLEQCADCAQELDARQRLRGRLRSAVRSLEAPAYLETRVRAHIRQGERPFRWILNLATVVATAVVLAVLTVAYRHGHLRMTQGSQEAYIASVSSQVGSLMRIGLGDHVHCAVFRKYPKNPPSMAQFAADMGSQYSGIIPIVRERVSGNFRLLIAHHCSYHGRRFVHLALGNDSALISVLITRKGNNEDFRVEEIVPELSEAGISIFHSDVQRFQIEAFESHDHMVYVISDLPATRNLELTENLAPALTSYLNKLAS